MRVNYPKFDDPACLVEVFGEQVKSEPHVRHVPYVRNDESAPEQARVGRRGQRW
jgi:hypothetical protein